jgi:hypothetical protein
MAITAESLRQVELDIAAIEKPYVVYDRETGKFGVVDWTRMAANQPETFRQYIGLRRGLRDAKKLV